MKTEHLPVMVNELLDALSVKSSGLYLDGTLGGGGHALAVSSQGGTVIGIDLDPEAFCRVQNKLQPHHKVQMHQDCFSNSGKYALRSSLDGAYLDLGTSMYQLKNSQRGFSLIVDGPLDMRFNPRQKLTAYDLIRKSSTSTLARILHSGGVRNANAVAELIKDNQRSCTTTLGLANLVASKWQRKGYTHPATVVFQALRMSVNRELPRLKEGLWAMYQLLKTGAALAVVVFHALEYQLVHSFMSDVEGKIKSIQRPSRREILFNPAARSAQLLVLQKLNLRHRTV